MRSDHWNFLANLLGTPGPAEPPQEKVAESTPSSTAKQEESPEQVVPGEPAQQSNDDEPPSTLDSAEDVLEALTSAVTSPRLPGFGPAHRAKDAELEELTARREAGESPEVSGSSRAARDSSSSRERGTEVAAEESAPQADDLDQTWGALAGELGIVAAEPPRRDVSRSSKPTQPRRPSSDSPKPPKQRSGGGFGSGLGLDIEPEPDDEDDDDDALSSRHLFAEVGVDEVDEVEVTEVDDDEVKVLRTPGSEKGSSPRGRDRDEGRRRGGRQPRGRARSDERPRDESRVEMSATRSFVDDDLDDEGVDGDVDNDFAPRGRVAESADRGDHSTSRPRRGRRGARQRTGESSVASGDTATPRGESAASKDDLSQPSRGRRGRHEGRVRDEQPDARRDRPSRDRGDDFGSDLIVDEFVEDDLDVEVRAESPAADDEDTPRPRRRRRRGRGGRGSREGRDARPERDDSDASRDDIPVSAFDDDLEDDEEVVEIRRSRPRSRDGQEEAEPRKRSSRDRGDRGRDSEERENPRRSNVPTWLETVDVLVNANIENHKRGGRGGNGGGSGRGRGSKRRS